MTDLLSELRKNLVANESIDITVIDDPIRLRIAYRNGVLPKERERWLMEEIDVEALVIHDDLRRVANTFLHRLRHAKEIEPESNPR